MLGSIWPVICEEILHKYPLSSPMMLLMLQRFSEQDFIHQPMRRAASKNVKQFNFLANI